jgi:hypothetical protein
MFQQSWCSVGVQMLLICKWLRHIFFVGSQLKLLEVYRLGISPRPVPNRTHCAYGLGWFKSLPTIASVSTATTTHFTVKFSDRLRKVRLLIYLAKYFPQSKPYRRLPSSTFNLYYRVAGCSEQYWSLPKQTLLQHYCCRLLLYG